MLWGIYSAIYGEVNVSVEKCVEIKGAYVEKYQSCFISVTLKSWSGQKLLDPTTYYSTVYFKESGASNGCFLSSYVWNVVCVFAGRLEASHERSKSCGRHHHKSGYTRQIPEGLFGHQSRVWQSVKGSRCWESNQDASSNLYQAVVLIADAFEKQEGTISSICFLHSLQLPIWQ